MKRFLIAALAALCPFFALDALAQCPGVSWGAAQTQSSATAIRDLVALDLDNDGKLDLVGQMDTPPPIITSDLYSWRGRGDGTFESPVSLNEHFIADVQLADVNNDGKKDIVTVHDGMISVRTLVKAIQIQELRELAR